MKTRKMKIILLGSLFAALLSASNSTAAGSGSKERIIRLDFNDVKGPFSAMFKECIGAGRANEGLRADWQQQLTAVKKECDFIYIRMHGLLTDDMGVYREDSKGNPEFNFQYIDVLYDFILGIGMKPFVELGFMPEALASGKQTIFWWRGNVTPPKDYQKWENFIRALTLHFTERYGADEVKTWYFEVWNEPNLGGFWAGTQEEYFKLYRHSVNAIKSVNGEYRVGGPATAGAAWVPEMIGFCGQNHIPLDFISTHSYGVRQGYLDEFGNAGTILDPDPMSVSGDILRSRREISSSAMPDLELHYTEWSSSYTPFDPMHDSYHQAAYVLQKIKQAGNAPNSMSYWVFTDIFEEPGPRFTPFHGGFGLVNYQGIQKPAFYSYRFMNRLGNLELADRDSLSWACRDSRGNVQVLLWDFTHTHPGDSVNNQVYFLRDLPPKSKGKAHVEISGIPEGTYRLEVYQVGYGVNDAYATYLSMGRPGQLTKRQVDEIKERNNGSPVAVEIVTVKSGEPFSKKLELRENDVFLLTLTKAK
jgi:xylan 1,4-beta-xylosidase